LPTDFHVHWLPPSIQVAELPPVAREFRELDQLLENVRDVGLTEVVLSPQINLCAENFEGTEALARAEDYNEPLLRAAAERPEVKVLGTVPLREPEEAARVLAELMAEPGCAGVEVSPIVGGHLLGDDLFESFWAAAAQTHALVFVHPTQRGFDMASLKPWMLWNTVGNPTETAMAAASLVMSGTIERHPRLRVLLAHGGGSVPALRGRLEHAFNTMPPARERITQPPGVYLRRFLYDTVVHDAELLRQLVSWVGAGSVVLGSDYPYGMGTLDPVGFVRSAGLESADLETILGASPGAPVSEPRA